MTDDERASVSAALTSLSDLLAPAHTRGGELDVVIGKLFAAFNAFTGDEGSRMIGGEFAE